MRRGEKLLILQRMSNNRESDSESNRQRVSLLTHTKSQKNVIRLFNLGISAAKGYLSNPENEFMERLQNYTLCFLCIEWVLVTCRVASYSPHGTTALLPFRRKVNLKCCPRPKEPTDFGQDRTWVLYHVNL